MNSDASPTVRSAPRSAAVRVLERVVEFVPGYDKRSTDPSKNYGISGGKFLFVVKGPEGAVHFVMGASFYPESAVCHLARHHGNDALKMHETFGPMGYDAGYHSPTPQYDGQRANKNCEWLNGRPCYSDGSALRADEWCREFLANGTEWLWPALEDYYYSCFPTADRRNEDRTEQGEATQHTGET